MPDLAWLVLALIVVVVFGRYVLRLLRRFAPVAALAVIAAVVLSQCDGSEINL